MDYLILVSIVLVMYWKTLWFGLTVDDPQAYKRAQTRKQQLFKEPRHVPGFIWDILYGAGLFNNTKYDHLMTICLTATIVCLLHTCFGSIWLALLYAVHPVNNQTNVWLNGRRYQISMIFALLAYKFVLAGVVFYPIAVWFHPVALPMVFIAIMFKSVKAAVWLITLPIVMFKLERWLKSRWKIQNFDEYKVFKWQKLVLATKNLGDYIRECLFPVRFTMYHPETWGLAELPDNRKKMYAIDLKFFASLSLIIGTAWLATFSTEIMMGYVIGVGSLVQWLGFWKNPTQLWAQRYATLASVGFCMYLIAALDFLGLSTAKWMLLTYYAIVTYKDLEMYRDFYSFFWKHFIDQPHNQNAHWFGPIGFNNNAHYFRQNMMLQEGFMAESHYMASAFLWCMRNAKHDLIHGFLKKKLNGSVKVVQRQTANAVTTPGTPKPVQPPTRNPE